MLVCDANVLGKIDPMRVACVKHIRCNVIIIAVRVKSYESPAPDLRISKYASGLSSVESMAGPFGNFPNQEDDVFH